MVHPAVKPSVSEQESRYRKKTYPDVTTVINSNARCTSCHNHVQEMIINGKPVIHPFLETLLCDKCDSFFGDGEFSVDEDGSDKYCRWCGQGGSLFLCSSCSAGFCKKCIRRNLPRSVLDEVEADDWQCFCCDVEPLYDLRAIAWAAVQYSSSSKKKTKRPKSDSDEDYMPKKTRKRKLKEHLTAEQKTVKMAFARYRRYMDLIESMCDVTKKKCIEVKSKRISNIGVDALTQESVLLLHEKLKGVLDLAQQDFSEMSERMENYIPEWKKALEKAREEDKESNEKLAENGESMKRKSKKSGSKDEESESETKHKRKAKSKKSTGDSDESEEESKPKSRKSNKDSDEEAKPKTKAKSRRSAKESDEESADEEATPKPKSRPRKSAKESDEESSDEEATPKPKSRPRKSAKESDEESTDEEASPKTKSRSRRSAKESDEESADEEASPKTKSRSRRSAKESDEESGDEEAAPKTKSKSRRSAKESDEESADEVIPKTKLRSKSFRQ